MRIFLAGATGVIGSRLVPLLIRDGHDVAGMTRSAAKGNDVRSAGAQPVVCDVFDADAVRAAVVDFRPEVVIHQLTDLPDDRALLGQFREANARIRRTGTANLLAAARTTGVSRFLAQSIAWPLLGDGGLAVAEHEEAVLAFGGVVIRYGQFYGPGTYYESELPPRPRVQIDTAAERTLGALEVPSSIVTITDEL